MEEKLILSHLVHNSEYLKKVLPFLKTDYFADKPYSSIFDIISRHTVEYGTPPNSDSILVELEKVKLSESDYKEAVKIASSLKEQPAKQVEKWLLDTTEDWCKERALYNAVITSASVLEGSEKKINAGALPDLLKDALAVSFDPSIGHDYADDWEKRLEFYHNKEIKIPFDLKKMNWITKGGVSQKTLNVILAGTGVGKTLAMCHFAAANLRAGYKVLYFTLEIAEELIAERIDANLMNLAMDEVVEMPQKMYKQRINRVLSKLNDTGKGKMIIKEFPTATANVNHFRHVLNELELKKDFKPDIIYVDYLNICTSARVKNFDGGMYGMGKAIAEELRGLAIEFQVPIVTATQTNRSGFDDSDVSLAQTSESFGIPQTADFMVALIQTEELEKIGQIQVKQLKNRYNGKTSNKKFFIGVDIPKMKFYDVDDNDVLSEPTEQEERIEISKRFGEGQGHHETAYSHKSKFRGFKV